MSGTARKRLLAVSSGGGHWDELMMLNDAFADFDVTYASTIAGIGAHRGVDSLVLEDFNRNHPLKVVTAFFGALSLVRRLRPAVVFSTGAAPGVMVLLAAKLLGARTVWMDSIANAEQFSLSGKLASRFVDLHCTQWEHLAAGNRSQFLGRVL